jgi:hypothetical protein
MFDSPFPTDLIGLCLICEFLDFDIFCQQQREKIRYRVFYCQLTNQLYGLQRALLEKLCIPNVTYRFRKSPLLVSILGQMSPLQSFPSQSSKINCNITFPSTSRSSKWVPCFGFLCISFHSDACCIPAHLILLYLIVLLIFSDGYKL